MGFLFLARGTQRFYIFLKGQEAAVRFLFWAGWGVFCAAVIVTSTSEVLLRRDALTFWSYESKRHPTLEAMNNLADAYARSKDFANAREFYQKAVSIDPKSIKAYEGLSRVAQEQGAWDLSVGYYQKIIALNPQWPQAYLGLGEAYGILGKTKEAVEMYSRLLELFPDDEEIDIKVIEAYGRAIEDNPQDDLYKEKREEVLADFEQLSKRKKYTAADYYNLGIFV